MSKMPLTEQQQQPTGQHLVCRGCWLLGTACKTCPRCKETEVEFLRDKARNYERALREVAALFKDSSRPLEDRAPEMFAAAWAALKEYRAERGGTGS